MDRLFAGKVFQCAESLLNMPQAGDIFVRDETLVGK
jgi:hypothetical protein